MAQDLEVAVFIRFPDAVEVDPEEVEQRMRDALLRVIKEELVVRANVVQEVPDSEPLAGMPRGKT
ncbi:MAG TPA: hypothetical protein VLK65_17065 [Vicinamibacteria bacterium]|nr:hypothetical protein [Vicinamibacteria bacterium]